MNTKLPVYEIKNEIVESIKNNAVTIVTAETGSGKSTQIPQYLYESGYKVIVTQPRRIACVSLAEFVSKEAAPAKVGYHTAFESTVTPDTNIIFCTDGLQMIKTVSGHKFDENTVLIVDEVHEWNLNVETIIAWIKHEYKRGKNIKVVIMSATFDTNALETYFKEVTSVNSITVKNKYFDVTWHHENKWEIKDIVAEETQRGKNILIFQPGKKEIDNCINTIIDYIGDRAIILPLHSELSINEQRKCFANYTKPKIVVSTNVAQTSVTIDDIDVVIDTGIEKFIEIHDGIESLVYNDISKADCTQRAGRAGRTKNGKYYLCSNIPFEERKDYTIPEIERLMLDKVVLKLADIGLNAEDLEFFHQPDISSIIEAKRVLTTLDAYNKDGTVSHIGHLMAKLPVGSKSARMLIEGANYGVLDEMIIIAAIIENGSLLYPKVHDDYYNMDSSNCYNNYVDTYKFYSDLILEMTIYKQLYDNTCKKTNGINFKTYNKIKAYIDKLSFCTTNILINNVTDEQNTNENIVKAMIPAMKDNLFEMGLSGMCTSLINNMHYKLSKMSCLTYKTSVDFVMGFPISLTVERKGIKEEIKLLQFATKITNEDIVSLIGKENLKKSYSESDIQYFPEEDEFVYTINYTMNNRVITQDKNLRATKADADLYDKLAIIYKNSDCKDKYIRINGITYEIIPSYYSRNDKIQIDNWNDVFALEDAGYNEIKTPKGQSIGIYIPEEPNNDSYYKFFKDINSACEYMIDKLIKEKETEIKRSFPSKTGKLETVLKWIPNIKETHYDVKGKTLSILIGLKPDKNSVKMAVFENEDAWKKSNKECMQILIKNFVEQKYNDKKFKVINWEGKKVENKKTEAAKYEFHENVNMVIEEADMENINDMLEYLKETFENCIAEMQNTA